jgi:GT2 family glycosyltransferase
MTGEPAPVTVVVPTIGRPELAACLGSLAACSPRAEEVLVVDQSEGEDVRELVESLHRPDFRVVACERRGVAHGTNVGLSLASRSIVLVTHDDCTVDGAWIGTAARLMADDPQGILTGRVVPAGDPAHVPSTIDLAEARDYAHGRDFSVLFPNNMALPRDGALEFGGFDERIPFAEDNDFCYRWLRAGRRMRYSPLPVVWHHDWRSRPELERLYVQYAIGQGVFYAKHLRQGDLRIARHVLIDVRAGARGVLARAVRGRERSSDWRQGVLRGLPIGLVRGWRIFSPRRLRESESR